MSRADPVFSMDSPSEFQDGLDEDIPGIDYRIRGFFNNKKPSEMREYLDHFLNVTGLTNKDDLFGKAMYLAQHPKAFGDNRDPPEPGMSLSREQQDALDLDADPVRNPQVRGRIPKLSKPDLSKWKGLPAGIWHVVLVCALGAMIQGLDEAAVNGAQGLYLAAFGKKISDDRDTSDHLTKDPGIAGLVNAAPYLCCAVSCWFTPLLNHFLGRRGTIFLCGLFSIFFAFAQAFAQTWQQLFAYRLLMGVGIGPKSATIPVYAAEAAPANIRGSLVTCWQAFTASGIALGCILSVLFQLSGDVNNHFICPPYPIYVDQSHVMSFVGPDSNFILDNKSNFTAQMPLMSYSIISNTTYRNDSVPTNRPTLLSWNCSWNWRLILASPMIPPIILIFLVYFCRESPRWTIAKAHRLVRDDQPQRARYYYQKAFKDLDVLSRDRLLAARDMFSHFYFIQREYEVAQTIRDDPYKTWLGNKLRLLFMEQRNRRSIVASIVCMFAQQFCGVNIFIYYSNELLTAIARKNSDFDGNNIGAVYRPGLLHTMGFGILNFALALPTFFLIDLLGRRTLLLITFPFLALSHFIAALSQIGRLQDNSPSVFLAGFYLFGIFYSPGEGPIPFVYASESMPLYIRDQGMGCVTSINWLLNWLVAFTAPYIFDHWGVGGTFAWYGGWCVVLWFLIFLLVPETRLLTLEQLDKVFGDFGSRKFARYAIESFKYRLYLRKQPPVPLYDPRLLPTQSRSAQPDRLSKTMSKTGVVSRHTRISKSPDLSLSEKHSRGEDEDEITAVKSASDDYDRHVLNESLSVESRPQSQSSRLRPTDNTTVTRRTSHTPHASSSQGSPSSFSGVG